VYSGVQHILTIWVAWRCSPLVFGICVAHRFSFLCCVFYFVCLRPVSCVPNVACFSGLSILNCPFGFLYRLLTASFSGLSILNCPFVFSSVYWLPVSLDCTFLIAPSVLAAVYWLPVSLHCPFLIATSGFSNVIFCHTYVVYVLSPRYKVHFTRKSYDCNLPVHIIIKLITKE